MRPAARLAQAERDYAKQLKLLARNVGDMIRKFQVSPTDPSSMFNLSRLLRAYAKGLIPWAKRVASRMIRDVNNGELSAWRSLTYAIGTERRRELETTPIGDRVKALLDLQVDLITSIPTNAARRVHELTLSGLVSSTRAKQVAEEIARSSDVTRSRALLIARTETSRTATVLLQARCESIGATHYIWRTANDHSVRAGHKAMAGKVCEWKNPPAVNEEGRIMHFHPGEIWNCRCYAEPIIPDPFMKKSRKH